MLKSNEYTSFSNPAETLEDPKYRLRLVDPPSPNSCGDEEFPLTLEEIRFRMAILVSRWLDVPLTEALRFCENRNPTLELISLWGEPWCQRYEWRSGAQGVQTEFPLVRQAEGVR